MKGARAALRYAKAILAFSQENNSSEAVAKDMQKMNGIIQQSDALQIALENPLIETEKKLSLLNELFPEASEPSKKLFSLLAERITVWLYCQKHVKNSLNYILIIKVK